MNLSLPDSIFDFSAIEELLDCLGWHFCLAILCVVKILTSAGFVEIADDLT
jgi:hypothetical protein